MEIKVTIGFNPESLAAITGLTAALSGTVSAKSVNGNGASNGTAKQAASSETVKETNGVVITLETLRKLSVDKANLGADKKEAVKGILKSYGVKSVSNVPEEKYTEFYNELNGL